MTINEDYKEYYIEISKKLLSFRDVRAEVTFNFDVYSLGDVAIAKLGIENKKLRLYLATENMTIELDSQENLAYALELIEDWGRRGFTKK